MSFIYTCNCEGVHGITGRRYVSTRRFIPTKVENGDICVYCGHHAVAECDYRVPRGKGSGGYKPMAQEAALRSQHGYTATMAREWLGNETQDWKAGVNHLPRQRYWENISATDEAVAALDWGRAAWRRSNK